MAIRVAGNDLAALDYRCPSKCSVEGPALRAGLENTIDRQVNRRTHPDLNQGPADLQSAALTTELCIHALR